MGKHTSRREFLGKALATAAFVALDPLSVILEPKELLASNSDGTLGAFVVDLTLPKYAKLNNVDGSLVITIPGLSKYNNKIILTRTEENTFVAVIAYCSHKQY